MVGVESFLGGDGAGGRSLGEEPGNDPSSCAACPVAFQGCGPLSRMLGAKEVQSCVFIVCSSSLLEKKKTQEETWPRGQGHYLHKT